MDRFGLYIKALLTSLFTAVSLRLNSLGDLLWLFIAAVVIDYLTGVTAAVYRRELNSSTGLRGIVKKVGECCVIAVALIADEVIAVTGSQIGVSVPYEGVIVTVVAIWLVLNELISILENLAKMNVALPSFLMAAIKTLKKQTEASVKTGSPEE